MKCWPSSLFASMSNGDTAQKGVTKSCKRQARVQTLPLRWNQSWVSPISSPMLVSGNYLNSLMPTALSLLAHLLPHVPLVLTIFDRR